MILEIDDQLQLKKLEKTDAEVIFRTIDNQREYLGKWLPFVALTKKLADTQAFVDTVVKASEEKSEYVFTILKNSEFVGLIGFNGTDKGNQKTEIGYWLSEAYQKQGIMTKSVAKICEFAFQELQLNRIQIKCAVGNHSSSKIPQRLGFTLEGIQREGERLTGNVFTDLQIYSKLKSDD